MVFKYFYRFFFFLLAISCQQLYATGMVEVRTADEFFEALKNHQSIQLKADLDLKDWEAPSIFDKISDMLDDPTKLLDHPEVLLPDYEGGEICGLKESYTNGEAPYYTLKNISGLAGYIQNLKVHHLVISGAPVAVFGLVRYCDFNEIIIEQSGSHIDKTETHALLTETAFDCTYKDIVVMSSSCWAEDERVGLLACNANTCTFDNCTSLATNIVYSGGGIVGGLVGKASDHCKFKNCRNYGIVIGNGDEVGGIVGRAEETSLSNCEFYGMAKHGNMEKETFCEKFNPLNYAMSQELKSGIMDYGYGLAYGGWGIIASIQELVYALDAGAWAGSLAYLAEEGGMLTRFIVWSLGFFVHNAALFYAVTTINVIMLVWSFVSLCNTIIEIAASFSGHDEVGGIVGRIENGSISDCSNYGMVYSYDAYAGGIAGYGDSADISNCLNQGAVHGDEQTGGIIGYAEDGSIRTSLNIGNVSCHNTETVGYICGDPNDVTTSYNCYTDRESDLGSTKTNDLRISQLDFVSGAATRFLDEKSGGGHWFQTVGEDHWPTLDPTHEKVTADKVDRTLSTEVNVYSANALTQALVNPYSDIVIMSDIDYKGYPAFNLSSSFMPFRGTIEGNGHRISNIVFSQDSKEFGFFGIELLWEKILNVGILGCAEGAHFSNIELCNIYVDAATDIENISLFVAKSHQCTYENISITGKSEILESDCKHHTVWKVGAIVGHSVNDTFSNCTVSSGTYLFANGGLHSATMGSIAGAAENSQFNYCWSAAQINGSRSGVIGGIVGSSLGCSIQTSLFTGKVSGLHETGGIAGVADAGTTVANCTFDGHVECVGQNNGGYGFIYSPYVSGLIGSSQNATVRNCFLFGSVFSPQCKSQFVGMNSGERSPRATLSDCYSHVEFTPYAKYEYRTYTSLPAGYSLADLASGAIAHYMNSQNKGKWFQTLDNEPFFIKYPVPLPAAGAVNRNVLCDGTITYSNFFSSSGEHVFGNAYGVCLFCGKYAPEYTPSEITLHSARQFELFAYSLNAGADYNNATITLGEDIDFEGVTDFLPIGASIEHPFRGTFDGNGYRIRNLVGQKGVFGVVGAGAVIRDVTVDATCSFTRAFGHVGGLVGQTLDEETETPVTIERCGNEALVKSYSGAGGILGHQGSTDVGKCAPVKISDCYNLGTIMGYIQVGALCGWGRKNLTMEHSWSHGGLPNCANGYLLVPYSGNDAPTLNACYVSQKYGSDNLARGASDLDFLAGEICSRVDEGRGVWGQSLGVDNFPVYTDQGIRHEREMGESEWGTVILPFDVESNEEVHYFKVISLDSDDGNHQMELQPVDVVKNNTPAFFKKLHPEQTKITFRPGDHPLIFVDILDFAYHPEQTPEATFYGTYVDRSKSNIVYSDLSSVRYTTSPAMIPACQAYLTYSGSINFADGDVITLSDLDPDASHLHSFSISKASGYRHLLTCDCGYTEYEDCYCTKYDGKGQGECCACGQHIPQPAVLTDNLCTITNPGQLCWFALEVNKGQDYDAILTADIDFTGVDLPWVPIGTYREAFEEYLDENGDINYLYEGKMVSIIQSEMFGKGYSGTFDGQGHIISHIDYDGGQHYPGHGLFGYINQGMVKNVGLILSEFKGYDHVASFVGSAKDAHLLNIFSTSSVYSRYDRVSYGGIGGDFEGTEIINGFYAGTLENENSNDHSLGPCYTGCTVSGFYTNIKSEQERGPEYLTDAQFRLGSLCRQLNSAVNTHNETNAGDWCLWSQQLCEDDVPTFGTQGVHLDRTMDADWGTLVLPYLVKSDEHIQFYKLYEKEFVLNDGKGYISVQKVDEVAPNTPCFFKRKNSRETTFTFAYNGYFEYSSPSTVVDERVALLGTYADMSDPTELFYVAQDQLVSAQSHPLESLPAHSAYLVVNEASGFSTLETIDFVEVEADGSHIHQFAISLPAADFRKNNTHLGTCQVCGLVPHLDCQASEYDSLGFGTCATCGQTCAQPVMIIDNNCPIANPGQLYWFATQVNNFSKNGLKATLDCDLDLSEVTMPWEPIGLYLDKYWEALAAGTVEGNAELTAEFLGTGYQGIFDGQGHVIRGIHYNGARRNPLHGLFGYVNGGTIRNVGIMDSEFAGYDHVGSLAGQVQNASIENFFSTADVSATVQTDYVGGVAGAFRGTSRLSNGFYTGQVKSNSIQVNRQTGLWDTDYTNDAYLSGRAFHALAADECNLYVLVSPLAEIAAGKLCQDLETEVITHNASEDNWAHWSQNLGTDSTPVFGESGIFHSREMSSVWGTLVLPYDLYSDDVVQYYTISSVELDGGQGYLILTEKKKVWANTPCIFKRKTSDTPLTLSFDYGALDLWNINTVSVDGLTINGTYQPLSGQTGLYYISQDKFWYAENPVLIPAFRAWLTTTSGSARALDIRLDGETSSIGEIRDGEFHFFDNEEYVNLIGQRVGADARGILINGHSKKVMVK